MTILATLFPRRTDVRVSTVQTISPARHLVCWHAHRHRWLAHTTPRLSLPVALSMLHIIPAPYFPRARVLLSKYKMTIPPPPPPPLFFSINNFLFTLRFSIPSEHVCYNLKFL